MKPLAIESWALRVLENVTKHLPVEDSRVELKAEWIDPKKAARRIAGHANAARGEPILWLIGVDEERGIVGANFQELADWFTVVEECFDGICPTLQSLNVPYDGSVVAALWFDTSRAPFVVRNPAFGNTAGEGVKFEVPWREGTKIRSATRHELILLLSSIGGVPKFEILEGEIRFSALETSQLRFNLKVYIVPNNNSPLTFPFHKGTAILRSGGKLISDRFEIRMDTPMGKGAKRAEHRRMMFASNVVEAPVSHINVNAAVERMEVTSDELVVRGAGKIEIDGFYGTPLFENWQELELIVTLVEAVTEAKVVLPCKFSKQETAEKRLLWILNKYPAN